MRDSYFFCLLLVTSLLSGCVSTHWLKEQEYLLAKQQIKGTQTISKEVLEPYYRQLPNSTWLGIPWGLWLYQLGRYRYDKQAIEQRIQGIKADFEALVAAAGKDKQKVQRLEEECAAKVQEQKKLLAVGTLLMRWGEAPVLYDDQQRRSTEKNLLTYLQSKGYFEAQVNGTVKKQGPRATVTYHVKEGQRYCLSRLAVRTQDQAVEALLRANQAGSCLQVGQAYDQEVLREERERIYALLRNHGYYAFDRQYVSFEVEKVPSDHVVDLTTVITTPVGRASHAVYHIDRLAWVFETKQAAEGVEKRLVVSEQGIDFKDLPLYLDPQLLAHKLSLPLPQLYCHQALVAAQQRLARLDMFKYIHLDYKLTGPGQIVPQLYTSLLEPFQFKSELGVQASEGILRRPFGKLSIQARHFLGQLETLKVSAHGSLEALSSAADTVAWGHDWDMGADLAFSWPQLLLPGNAALWARLQQGTSTTEFSLGGSLTQRPAYRQSAIKSLLSYTWQDDLHATYVFVPFQLDWIDSVLDVKFRKELEKRGSNLSKSFEPSLLSVVALKGSWSARPVASQTGQSTSRLDLLMESGGMLSSLLDLSRLVPWLEHYQYVKLDLSYRQYIPLSLHTLLAYSFHTGVAYPYGANKVLPYGRYYFAGGANSMRAWKPRSLGPGSYKPSEQLDASALVEQPGELSLQGSIELRQSLVSFLEGAVFVDVGNIWTLQEDERVGGVFALHDFYKKIAVGMGVGFRLNLGFLLLRLDGGIQLYDPAGAPSAVPIYHISIGYPF